MTKPFQKQIEKGYKVTKLVAIGDIHGRKIWLDIIKKEKPDIVVLIGDYFDSFDIDGNKQVANFYEIIKFKEENPEIEFIILYGNHEHHYLRSFEIYSGYQHTMVSSINEALNYARRLDAMDCAYSYDDLLFTHAGVSTTWWKTHIPHATMETLVSDINKLFRTNLEAFDFIGFSRTGDSKESSPIWIREGSLLKSNKNTLIKSTFRQVFGHTMTSDLNLEKYKKYLGGRYIPIDALDKRQYLIYENKELSVGKLEPEGGGCRE